MKEQRDAIFRGARHVEGGRWFWQAHHLKNWRNVQRLVAVHTMASGLGMHDYGELYKMMENCTKCSQDNITVEMTRKNR